MIQAKNFNNQSGITSDSITTNTILSSAGATILSTTAADSSINLKITTNAVTSNAVYYDVANDKLSYGAVSSGGGSILATANTFTNTNTFNAAVNLNGIPSATKTNVLYYDTTSKAISYGAASSGSILTTANTFTNLNTFQNSVTFQSAVNFSLRLTFPFWSVATGGSIPSDYSGGFTVITMGTGTNVTLFNPNITSGFVMTIQNIIAGQTITITTGGGGFYGAGLTNGSSTLSLYYLQAVRLNCNGSSWFVVSLTHNMTLYPTLANANTFAETNNFTGAVNNSGAVRFTNASNSISIGSGTNTTGNVANSIVLNATVDALSPATVNACYINPIRNITTNNNILNYNPTTKEVTYQQKGYLYYTTTTAQSIPNGAEATTLFNTTNSARNVAINGLTFNSATGLFTNSSGSTLYLSISYGVGFNDTNTAGYRALWIKHSAIGYVSFYQISATVGGSTVICTSGLFSLLNGETFECRCYQNSGGALTIVNTAAYPTVIHICQQ